MCGVNEEIKKKKELQQGAPAPAEENALAAPVLAQAVGQEQLDVREEIMEQLPVQRERLPLQKTFRKIADPIVEQPVSPADMTYKQRRKLKKQDRKAKDRSPYADHVSLAIEKQLTELTVEKNASNATGAGNAAEQEGKRIDGRELVSFITGYKQDKDGNPLNEQEAEKKEKDRRFLEDYTSGDLQRRLPHLERMKNEMLQMRLSPDMLTEAYLEKHAAEVYNIVSKLTYFEGVQKDPVNAPFFEQLPEAEKKLIQYRTKDLCVDFCGLWLAVLGSKSITLRDSEVLFVKTKSFHDTYAGQIPMLREQLKRSLAESDRKEEELRKEVFPQLVQDCIPAQSNLGGSLGGEEADQELNEIFHHNEYVFREKTYQGRVALMDAEYENHGDAAALQASAIRNSNHDAAKVEKKLRGNFFNPLAQDYKEFFRNLADAGVDFEEIRSRMQRCNTGGVTAYVTGGGVEQIYKGQYELFSRYVFAPQGKAYVARLFAQFKDAKVFQGRADECVDFILQAMINFFGANNQSIMLDREYYGEHAEAVKEISKETCRTLLGLYRARRLSAEATENLHPEMKQLLERYSSMIRTLCESLNTGEGNNAPGGE